MSAPRESSTGSTASAPSEIDVSCRLPLFVMFVSAAVWLVIASIFGVISTLKFHNPNFLADFAWLTYGRTHPAYVNCVLYGFCIQTGLGFALWLFARLGQARLMRRWIVTIGAMLWNLGVTVGVIGILAGDSTGFENLEMPFYAAIIIFLGYVLIGIWTVLTFHHRRERALYVSQWFLLAALFWFPWIYSTAYLSLITFPVRGMTQAVIAWWFSQNLLVVWFGLVGLAGIFYFLPKLTTGELHSSYFALITFWVLILLGGWGGVPNSAPVPAWMPSISTATTVLMFIPMLTVALNLYGNVRGQNATIKANLPLKFICVGLLGYFIAGLMNFAAVLPGISQVTNFTWVTPARLHAEFYGFFTLVMFGAIYYILPRLAGLEFASAKLLRLHWWTAVIGILLIVAPLAIGGLVQGFKLQNANIAFLDVSKTGLMFLRISTLGDLLIAAGHLIFLVNVGGVVSRFYRLRAVAAYSAATADLFKTAEAKT